MKNLFMNGIAAGLLLFLANIISSSASELPSTIDLNSASQTGILTVNGEKSGDKTGLALGSGDINGDGLMDIVFGGLYASPEGVTQSGIVYVIFGSKNLKTTATFELANNPEGLLRIQGESAGATLGQAVAVGDVDGDGYCDIVMGANEASPQGRSKAGAVYILFGSPDLSSAGTIDIKSTSRTLVKLMGEIGASSSSQSGKTAGDPVDKILTPQEYSAGDQFGRSVTAGDLNGDGCADVIIGALNASAKGRNNAGKTYVLFGSASLRQSTTIDMRQPPSGTLVVYGRAADDYSGFFTAAGDLNGDNYSDLAVGMHFADPDGIKDAGEVDIVFGSKNLASTEEIDLAEAPEGVIRLKGNNVEDYTGCKLSVGDLDHDGYGDLCICAYGADTPGGINAGKAYVVFGASSLAETGDINLGVHGNRVLCIMGEASENYYGPSAFGDVNGDGVMDLITGANGFDPSGRYDAGKGYVIFGSAALRSLGELDLREPSTGVLQVPGSDSNGRLGFVCASCDMDGDGYSEIIFGAHDSSPAGRSMAGKVYVLFGNDFTGTVPVSQNHFTFTVNTGKNAVALIPKDAIPTIDGNPIAAGDEIGFFTPTGICAGAGVWNGNNLAITVWGDDTNTTIRDGFPEGESYSIRIWDASADRVYSATARYSQGTGVYYTDSISILSALEVKPVELNLPLSAGWNMVSSPVIAVNSALENLLSGIEGNMALLKNGSGELYWPKYDISQVKEWDVTGGYQIYMNAPGEIHFSGYEAFPNDVAYSLHKNWNLISFIGAESMSPSDAFDSLGSKLVLVKDGNGNVYWPQYNVNQIQKLHRGSGYWICLNNAASFTYPNTVTASKTETDRDVLSNFKPVSGTGNNAVLLIRSGLGITLDGKPLATGTEIGIFSPSGVCVGAGRWEEGKNCAIAVWGDNTMTGVSDGILPGEEYMFAVWDKATGQQYLATAIYSEGDAQYAVNGVSVVGILRAGTSVDIEEIPRQFSLSQNTPNPFNPSTSITFTIPQAGPVRLTVYDAVGRMVADLVNNTLSAGSHSVVWNASGCATGVYFYKIKAGTFTETRKMLLMK